MDLAEFQFNFVAYLSFVGAVYQQIIEQVRDTPHQPWWDGARLDDDVSAIYGLRNSDVRVQEHRIQQRYDVQLHEVIGPTTDSAKLGVFRNGNLVQVIESVPEPSPPTPEPRPPSVTVEYRIDPNALPRNFMAQGKWDKTKRASVLALLGRESVIVISERALSESMKIVDEGARNARLS